jgi:hypothetical protein
MSARGLIDGQVQVGEDFAQEEIGAGIARDQVGVLADPPEAGIAGECLFQHRRAIGIDPMTVGANQHGQVIGQLLQRLAHQPVIVAAESVTRYVSGRRIGQHLCRRARFRGPVVHARADDAQRAREQLCRSGAHASMACHVVHVPVPASLEPLAEAQFVLIKCDSGNPDVGKPERVRTFGQHDSDRARVRLRASGAHR